MDTTNGPRWCLMMSDRVRTSLKPFRQKADVMNTHRSYCTRRGFLGGLAAGAVAFAAPGAFAEELFRTAAQTEGPFYPDKLPLDTDNDLIIVNDGLTSAVGTIAHVTGKILDTHGDPIKNALVEIDRKSTRLNSSHLGI